MNDEISAPAAEPAPQAPAASSAPSVLPPPAADLPAPVVARQNRLRLSLVWIVPFVAVVAGVVLVVRALLQTGPEIRIEFRSAEGLEAGKTEVRFKEVAVGRVKQVSLTPDRQKVVATVALAKTAAGLAVQDTRFWVVRPRIGTAGVSGLSTLLSGAYIGVDAGAAEDSASDFVGLDTPPLVLRGEPGRSFVLRADDLGSLDVGSPVYHRRVRVGRVVGFSLDDSGRTLLVKVFVEAPYEKLVSLRSRFWNSSGVDLSLSASGLTLHTQSLASVLAGGIAFADVDPPADAAGTAVAMPAAAGQLFQLHGTQREAMAPEDGEPLRVRMVFRQSLRGLEVGAPVELMGVSLGTVRGVELQSAALAPARIGRALGTRAAAVAPGAGEGLAAGAASQGLSLQVTADIYTLRLGRLREQLSPPGTDPRVADRLLMKQLVERGLRAQARTANLLTGQLYVSLDFASKAEPVRFDSQAAVPSLPTTLGTLAELQPQLMDVLSRISKIRFDEIGNDVQQSLAALKSSGASLETTLASANTLIKTLTPTAQQALVDVQKTLASAQQTLRAADASLLDPQAALQRSTTQTLAELQRTAQALRVLADYLQRHPESLLRGKPADALEGPK